MQQTTQAASPQENTQTVPCHGQKARKFVAIMDEFLNMEAARVDVVEAEQYGHNDRHVVPNPPLKR